MGSHRGFKAAARGAGRPSARACHEVAQLYINDKSATVSFTLTRADLGFVHPDKRSYAEPGAFDVWVAPNATAGAPATFVLKPGA